MLRLELPPSPTLPHKGAGSASRRAERFVFRIKNLTSAYLLPWRYYGDRGSGKRPFTAQFRAVHSFADAWRRSAFARGTRIGFNTFHSQSKEFIA
jgi:hypothetical protein